MKGFMNSCRIIAWCESAMRFSYYGLIFFLPISTALTEIFATIALIGFFVKRGLICVSNIREKLAGRQKITFKESFSLAFGIVRPVPSDLNKPIGAFIFVGFFTIFISQYPLLSLQGFFFKLLELTYLYFIFIECMKEKRHLKIFLFVFFISAALTVLSGLYQQITNVDFMRGFRITDGRSTASFGHSNSLGAYIITITPIILAYNVILNEQNYRYLIKWRILSFLLFVLSVACLGYTFSRGAWVAFFVTMIIFGLFRPKVLPMVILILFSFILFFLPQLEARRNVLLLKDNTPSPESSMYYQGIYLKDEFKLLKYFNASGREFFWNESIRLIKKYPLGTGLNTYSRVSRDNLVSWSGFPYWSGYPHNCFLQLTVEMGYLGILAFCWIIFAIYRTTIRHIISRQNKNSSLLVLGVLTGLSGFLLHSSVDTNFYSVQLGNLMWVVMGLLMATLRVWDLKNG